MDEIPRRRFFATLAGAAAAATAGEAVAKPSMPEPQQRQMRPFAQQQEISTQEERISQRARMFVREISTLLAKPSIKMPPGELETSFTELCVQYLGEMASMRNFDSFRRSDALDADNLKFAVYEALKSFGENSKVFVMLRDKQQEVAEFAIARSMFEPKNIHDFDEQEEPDGEDPGTDYASAPAKDERA